MFLFVVFVGMSELFRYRFGWFLFCFVSFCLVGRVVGRRRGYLRVIFLYCYYVSVVVFIGYFKV